MNTQSLTPPTKEEKSKRIDDLRMHYNQVFNQLGASIFSFFPKMQFPFNGQPCLALYVSEFNKETGFYTQLIDRQFTPENGEYKLLFLKKNPAFATTYTLMETDKYAVPLSDFEEINVQSTMLKANLQGSLTPLPIQPPAQAPLIIPAPTTPSLLLDGQQLDNTLSEMTVRDVAAILWAKPISNKGWLNHLIKTQHTQS
jgi:hypothetical protein